MNILEMVESALKETPAVIINIYTDEDGDCVVSAESHDGSFGFGGSDYPSFDSFMDDLVYLTQNGGNLTYQLIGTLDDLATEAGLNLRITKTLTAAEQQQ